MKPSETIEIFKLLRGAFPAHPVLPETAHVYALALADVDYLQAQAAVLKILNDGAEFFPTIGRIRAAISKLNTPGSEADGASEWENVIAELRRIGFYGVPKFENPITAQAVRAMGWYTLCHSENSVADRAHFIKIFDSMRGRAVQIENTKHIALPPVPEKKQLDRAPIELEDNTNESTGLQLFSRRQTEAEKQ